VTYPNQPQPGYPPANVPPANYPPSNVPPANFIPPGYPPQYPQYPQQYPPQYAPQGYAPPAAPAPAQPVLARGTLEDYLDQPSGGGGAATSKFFTDQRPVGSWLQLRVARDLNHGDVRQQTDKFGTPLTFKSSGKPKFVLIIPCQVLASNDGSHQTIYPEGQVTVWLKGVPSDSFKQAMAAGGVSDPAEALRLGQLAGAEFYMIGAGKKQFGQGNPANMFDFQYTSNGRELAQSAPPAAPVPPTAPAAPSQAYAPPTAPAQPQQTLPASPPASGYSQQPPQPQFASMDPAGYQAAGSPPFPPAPPQMPPVPPPGIPATPPVPAGPSGAATMPSSPPPPPGYPPQPQYQQAPPPPPGYAPQAPGQQAPGMPQLDDEKAKLLNRLNGQG